MDAEDIDDRLKYDGGDGDEMFAMNGEIGQKAEGMREGNYGLTGRDVVASWAGLRPLLNQSAAADARTTDLSRQHVVYEDPPGLFTITGGKLTTYRAMAEDLVDRVSGSLGPRGRCRTSGIPLGLHGPVGTAVRLARAEAARAGLPPGTGARLVRRYGDDWREAIRLIGQDRSLGEPAVDGLPVLNVELDLARTREMAITAEDVFVRRTRLTTRDASVRLPPFAGAVTPSGGSAYG